MLILRCTCPRWATRGRRRALLQCCGQTTPGVSTAPLGARHARAAILLGNSQGLGTSSGSRRLEQRGSAWPPGTRGLQAASSDAGPEHGDPLLSAPAAAR